MRFDFSFPIMADGAEIARIEDCHAIVEPDVEDKDEWRIDAIYAPDGRVPDTHYLYEPMLEYLCSGDVAREIDEEWGEYLAQCRDERVEA